MDDEKALRETFKRAHANRSDHPDVASHLFREALEVARANGFRRWEGLALRGVAQIARDQGRHGDSLRVAAGALALFREIGDRDLVAHTLRHIGDELLDTGQPERAASYAEESVAMRRSEEGVSDLEMANTLRPLARLREAQSRPAEAAELWREIRAIYVRNDIAEGIAECDAHLSAT